MAQTVMRGYNPALVYKMTLDNILATKKYITDRKELNRIILHERIGTATASELKRKGALRAKLTQSRVYPLMKHKMFSSIIEDVSERDFENSNKIAKLLEKSKTLKNLPDIYKRIGKELWMTEGSVVFDFMNQLTMFSDFASRCTEYQLQMKEAPKKYEKIDGKTKITDEWTEYEAKVIFQLWDMFVNYDTPTSNFLQYMNDMGFMMFTKYFIRIQKRIINNLTDRPVSTLLFSLANNLLVDVEDIMEQNIFYKSYSSILHNPLGQNVEQALVPAIFLYGSGAENLRWT